MALGADQREIVKLIVGQGLRITLWSVAAGLAMALAVTRLIAAQSRTCSASAVRVVVFPFKFLMIFVTYL
jgi:predicted lysophospholipase L1 biosynthesis ABC-type transport system permease subunit